jgi:hypothetical protein
MSPASAGLFCCSPAPHAELVSTGYGYRSLLDCMAAEVHESTDHRAPAPKFKS